MPIASQLAEQIGDAIRKVLLTHGNPDESSERGVRVLCNESGVADTGVQDLEVITWMPDSYVSRKQLQKCNDELLMFIRRFLSDYDRNIMGWSLLYLQPAAFGAI
jgi:hypothetical protein